MDLEQAVKHIIDGDAVLFLGAGFFANWFNLSPEAHKIAVDVLRAFSITSLFIWPLSFTLSNSLRAAGDVNFTMTVSIASMWITSSYMYRCRT